MKKLAILVLVLCLALIYWFSIDAAYNRGVLHALEDSEMWIMEVGVDPDICILLDGDWYVHHGYIG